MKRLGDELATVMAAIKRIDATVGEAAEAEVELPANRAFVALYRGLLDLERLVCTTRLGLGALTRDDSFLDHL